MSDMDDMEAFIDRLPPVTRRALTIVTREELKNTPLLHISPNNNIRNFVPVIGFRQFKDEDRTVPRVCTAPTLLGCMLGHGAITNLFFSDPSDNAGLTKKESFDGYKGGFTIYGFDSVELALKPAGSLVEERVKTDEHWLVAYNSDTAKIAPKVYGKFFYTGVAYSAVNNKGPSSTVSLLVEVTREAGLEFSKNHHLGMGCWMVTGPECMTKKSWRDDDGFVITKIEKSYYDKMKKTCADLLSHSTSSTAPIFANW